MIERRLIAVEGVVQGVGFRPHVHRLASAQQLAGFVRNEAARVFIDVEGRREQLEAFCRALERDAPPHARIERTRIRMAQPRAYREFRILESAPRRSASTKPSVPVDVPPCETCVAELFDPVNRRFEYPFISCAECGPRFSVIRDTPYDRMRTTMAAFSLCDACRQEYEDPTDRRFHAETIACPTCGPCLRACDPQGAMAEGRAAIAAAVTAIRNGAIVALKAVGGYHLACDATSQQAVERLRQRKRRAAKPFAIMVPDLACANSLGALSPLERSALTSTTRPIVLLERHDDGRVAAAIAPAQRTLGVMLPSSPLHALLLARLARPLVMTSGNRSDEPVAITEGEAFDSLGEIADLFLTHDREIAKRCDDSIVRRTAGETRVVRRARGLVPNVIRLRVSIPRPVLAVGGHLKNTICVAHGEHAALSPHVGDLESAMGRRALDQAIEATTAAARMTPAVIAHDFHPDYASTAVAETFARRFGVVRRVAVQHHHAHIAACVAEHGVREPVIGVAFDGTGLGTDGAIWGGEFLVVSGCRFARHGHLEYVPLPGGDSVARRPWRSALAHVAAAAPEWIDSMQTPEGTDAREWNGVRQLSTSSRITPLTSSAGRLFDAVASLLGVCQVASFDGEAPMALESIADPATTRRYPAVISGDNDEWTIGLAGVVRGVVEDRDAGVAVEAIAGAFHTTLAEMIRLGCERVRDQTGLVTVALSGGVFMNALLVTRADEALRAAGFRVLIPRDVPCNDGGLSLGQAYVAGCALQEELCV